MTPATASPALDRVINFLGDVGPRWGLPGAACRVHGYLYLVARPIAEADLRAALDLSETALSQALVWLADYRLVERVRADTWRTGSDPWELMMRALEERQRREIGPALGVLRDCRRVALAEGGSSRAVAAQIGKLLRLAEDIEAISNQAQRLSPATVRQMVGLGGFAARILNRTPFGRRKRS
jgi:DNA-binding transcriptional regulator GbsR (MarR family)